MRFRNSPQLWAPRRAALQSHVPDKVTRFLADDGQNRKSEVMRSRIGTGKRTCIEWPSQLPGGRQTGSHPETGFEEIQDQSDSMNAHAEE
jgi:hypothetical protein